MAAAESGAARAGSEADRRWAVLAVCLVAGFMTLLDVSIVNVALPSMQRGLDASPASLAWVVSGYALTFGLVLVPAGRLGDDRGRSRMFVYALAVFTVASLVAGLAMNPLWLVLARLFQGVAGGMLNPQVLGLIQQMFQGTQRGRAFGLFGAVVGVSTAVGPLLGGLIIHLGGSEHGWRWVFFVNLPIGVAGILFARRILPSDRTRESSSALDMVGVVLLGSGLLCLLLPLVERSGTRLRLLMLAAPVLLAAFTYWEHRYRLRGYAPLVDLRLLRIRSYVFGCSIGLLYFAGFTSIFFVLAVYFQRGIGYSALQAGLALTPFALGSAVFSAMSGRFVHRLGRGLVVIGIAGALLGLVSTDLLLRGHFGTMAGLVTALPLLVAGCGGGLVVAPNQTVTLSEVDTSEGGTAAGVQQTGQRIGSSLGIATVSGTFFAALPHGGYDAAISVGLLVSICLVSAALLLGLIDVLLPRRRCGR